MLVSSALLSVSAILLLESMFWTSSLSFLELIDHRAARGNETCDAAAKHEPQAGKIVLFQIMLQRMVRTRSAARSPDRTDPSMVAGSPVSVQSPARNRFLNPVTVPGRSAFCSGVASNVARR